MAPSGIFRNTSVISLPGITHRPSDCTLTCTATRTVTSKLDPVMFNLPAEASHSTPCKMGMEDREPTPRLARANPSANSSRSARISNPA